MSFAARMTRCPDAFDPAIGQEAALAFGDQPPEIRELIAGAAGCSPYLQGLLAKETEWITQALDDPEAAADGVLARLPDLTLADLPGGLREAKRRMALLTALCDLAGVWPLETVTHQLSLLADGAVDAALKRLVAAEIDRGKLPGLTDQDAETAGGMVSIAMGKGGAFELNYSSDIDLICLFDETRFDPDDYYDVRAAFVRDRKSVV